MQYFLLATDYDGTLASDGRVRETTFAALHKFRQSGRRLILVTGRELDDLLQTCPDLSLFEWVVAENGALLYEPSTRQEKMLARPFSEEFLDALRAKGIEVGLGKTIISTSHFHETEVLKTIHEMGLELQIIFNKGSLMVLPTGINKASGLKAALREMRMSPHNTVAIGDAENDHALLDFCDAGIAVANAVPMLRWKADLVTEKENGEGVEELIEHILANDLSDLQPRLKRNHLLLGQREDGTEVRIPTRDGRVLIIGASGSGKTSLAAAIMEQLVETRNQFCMIDPEGDYQDFEGAISIGTHIEKPESEKMLQLLDDPRHNVAVNLIGISFVDRPAVFHDILSQLQAMRIKVGRPHWILIDETHHVLPEEAGDLSHLLQSSDRTIFITLEPQLVLKGLVDKISTVLIVGKRPLETLQLFPGANEIADSFPEERELEKGEFLLWEKSEKRPPFYVRFTLAHPLQRHSRKYVEGKLEPSRAFYFRGPEEKLNLPAPNLLSFLQIAGGIDDESWLFHLRRGDYSNWFRDAIKDPELAQDATEIEREDNLTPDESRQRIFSIIEKRYSLPAADLKTYQEKA